MAPTTLAGTQPGVTLLLYAAQLADETGARREAATMLLDLMHRSSDLYGIAMLGSWSMTPASGLAGR